MIKAHPDCPDCQCWQAEPGERVQFLLNGVPLRDGQRRTLCEGDEVTLYAVKILNPGGLSRTHPRHQTGNDHGA